MTAGSSAHRRRRIEIQRQLHDWMSGSADREESDKVDKVREIAQVYKYMYLSELLLGRAPAEASFLSLI